VSRDGAEVTSAGRSFHMRSPVTGKARCPIVNFYIQQYNNLTPPAPIVLMIAVIVIIIVVVVVVVVQNLKPYGSRFHDAYVSTFGSLCMLVWRAPVTGRVERVSWWQLWSDARYHTPNCRQQQLTYTSWQHWTLDWDIQQLKYSCKLKVEVNFRSKKYIQMLHKVCKEAGKEAKACAHASALCLRLHPHTCRSGENVKQSCNMPRVCQQSQLMCDCLINISSSTKRALVKSGSADVRMLHQDKGRD